MNLFYIEQNFKNDLLTVEFKARSMTSTSFIFSSRRDKRALSASNICISVEMSPKSSRFLRSSSNKEFRSYNRFIKFRVSNVDKLFHFITKCISSSKLIPYFRPSFLGACKGVFQCFNFSSQSQNRRFACIRFWLGYLTHRRCNTYSFTCICCMINGSIWWYRTGCSPYCRRRRRSGRSRRWDHRQFRSSTMMSRRWRWGVWSYWWILLIWWCSRSPSWKFLFWFSWCRRSWWKSVANSSAAVIWLEWFVQMKMNRMWRRRDIDSCICNIFIWYILKGENLYIIGVVLYYVLT